MRYFRVAPVMALDDVRRFGRSWNLGLLVRTSLPGDPRGYRSVDVGERSFFDGPLGARQRASLFTAATGTRRAAPSPEGTTSTASPTPCSTPTSSSTCPR